MSNLQGFNALELTLKHCYLMQEIEGLPPGSNILLVKKKEAEALEDELRKRLHKNLNSDVLPANYIATLKSPRKPKPTEKKTMIPFRFEVFSSMKTLIDRFKVEASTKEEAWKEAEEKAKKYPGDVKLKIS